MAKRKILLAEDDATMVSLLKTLLSMEGYQVVVLANEVNILEEIRAHQPDVLILDLHLFDLNGLDILENIRNASDIAGLRVIMSSGSNVKEECLNRGAQGFLMKPYIPDDLFKLLKKSHCLMRRFQIREFEFDKDYEPVLKLWQSIETGINIGRSDTPEEIQKKIQRDPDLFLLAEAERKVVGSVIGGFDGRRGMVYHLAVHDQYRKQGIGSALLAEVEKRLKTKGCLKMYLLVLADNSSVLKFYEECGWRHAVEDLIFMKEL